MMWILMTFLMGCGPGAPSMTQFSAVDTGVEPPDEVAELRVVQNESPTP